MKGFLHSTYQIEISNVLLRAETSMMKEILAHEVLHSCPGCMNHGPTWKNHCKKMENAYGYRLERTSTYEKLGIEDQRKSKAYRYVVECTHCGQRIYRQRKSALTDEPSRYRCRCGGQLICSILVQPR